jgi:hypothetical protein
MPSVILAAVNRWRRGSTMRRNTALGIPSTTTLQRSTAATCGRAGMRPAIGTLQLDSTVTVSYYGRSS